MPEEHRREAATGTCCGKRWRSDCKIGQTIVKRGQTVVKRSLMLKKPPLTSSRYAVEPGSIPLTSSRYGPGVTTSRFAQLATRWLSGREPGSNVSSPSSRLTPMPGRRRGRPMPGTTDWGLFLRFYNRSATAQPLLSYSLAAF